MRGTAYGPIHGGLRRMKDASHGFGSARLVIAELKVYHVDLDAIEKVPVERLVRTRYRLYVSKGAG